MAAPCPRIVPRLVGKVEEFAPAASWRQENPIREYLQVLRLFPYIALSIDFLISLHYLAIDDACQVATSIP
jgi:hypothetical protein